MLPNAIRSAIEEQLGPVVDFNFISGGSINHAAKIITAQRSYFIKWNDLVAFPRMLELEAKGLAMLRSTNAIDTPEVICVGITTKFQYLVLEFISSSNKKSGFWKTFGMQLAALHSTTAEQFGLDDYNYIGSLPQRNSRTSKWTEFFIAHRIMPQLSEAIDNHYFDLSVSKKFERLFLKLSDIFPDEKPALCHGDLWSGNLMTNAKGEPCLIDPAVHFGNREADLAMTSLFGGFDERFLEAYKEILPLLPGYASRVNIYNLYPLLVHTNLFGGSYAGQVVSILNQIV